MRDLPQVSVPFLKAQELADRELVDRLVRGDGQAADKFVRLHKHLVMRELRRFRNLSPETRDDLFQEIFAKLFEDECRILGQWKGNSNFVAYLRRIVSNICIDHLRTLDRAPPIEPIGEDEDELADRDGANDPEREAQLNELRKLMRLAIQSLAPPDQEILTLIVIKESSYEQVAELLGISRNLAGVRLFEAKKRLRKIIEQSHPCRQAIATHVMQSSLMKAGNASRGSDHLDARQIRDLYAAAFEGDEMTAVQFVTGMWHLKSCNRCLMHFRGRHQDLTPSAGLLTAALATFWRGRPVVPLGTLTIKELLRKATVQFEPTPTGAAQGIVEVQAVQRPGTGDSEMPEGRGRKLVDLIGKPLKGLRQTFGAALSSARLGDRLKKLVRFRKGEANPAPPAAEASSPRVIQVRGLLLAVDARQEGDRLLLEIQLVGQESGSPVSGATVVAIDSNGTRAAAALTNEEGLSTVDLSSMPAAVRIELGIGQEPWELKLRRQDAT